MPGAPRAAIPAIFSTTPSAIDVAPRSVTSRPSVVELITPRAGAGCGDGGAPGGLVARGVLLSLSEPPRGRPLLPVVWSARWRDPRIAPSIRGGFGRPGSELAGDRSGGAGTHGADFDPAAGVHGRIFERAVIEAVSSGGVTWTVGRGR